MRITIKVPPVTKKNSQRIVKVRGRSIILPSKKYKDYERACAEYVSPLESPIDYPVNVKMLFYMQTRRKCDLPNHEEACLDVLTKYKVLEDDNYNIVAGMDGSRVLYDKENPRTEIEITRMEGEEDD